MGKWWMGERWAMGVVAVRVIISAVPPFIFVGKNFLPVDDQAQFEINVRLAEGSTLSATTALSERLAADMRKMPGVTDTLVTIGSGQQQIVNLANIYIKLSPIEERTITQQDLMLRTRSEIVGKYLKEMPELRTSVNPVAAISGGGQRNADINFVI